MRCLCALLILVASIARADEPERVLPFSLRSSRAYKAVLTGYTPRDLKYYVATALKIRDDHGRIIFYDRDTLGLQRAVNAAWSPSGDFLVVVTVNGEGHSPWQHSVYIFSVRDAQLHPLKAPDSSAFVSGKIAFERPNLVRLVAGSYTELPAEAIDHPRPVSYDLTRGAGP